MFLGVYEIIPTESNSNEYTLQQDYGFLRGDGLLIIAAKGVRINGANIPRFLWRMIGSPMYGMNKYWSAPHDVLYGKHAIILDTNATDASVYEQFRTWHDLPAECFKHQTCYDKLFADDTLKQAMQFLDERWIKVKACYRAVRLFGRGWWSGKK